MGCCTARPKDETKETSNYIPYYNISFKEDTEKMSKIFNNERLIDVNSCRYNETNLKITNNNKKQLYSFEKNKINTEEFVKINICKCDENISSYENKESSCLNQITTIIPNNSKSSIKDYMFKDTINFLNNKNSNCNKAYVNTNNMHKNFSNKYCKCKEDKCNLKQAYDEIKDINNINVNSIKIYKNYNYSNCNRCQNNSNIIHLTNNLNTNNVNSRNKKPLINKTFKSSLISKNNETILNNSVESYNSFLSKEIKDIFYTNSK